MPVLMRHVSPPGLVPALKSGGRVVVSIAIPLGTIAFQERDRGRPAYPSIKMVITAGYDPATFAFGKQRSFQLSYVTFL